MRQSEKQTSRIGRRVIGTVITALVLVAVLALNIVLAVVGANRLWVVDETADKYTHTTDTMYTASEPFLKLMREDAMPAVDRINAQRAAKGQSPIKIEITFCDERDVIDSSDTSRYVLYTALELQKTFPEQVHVSFVDAERDPSLVQKYKTTAASRIYSSNVIVEFGTEFRVCPLNYFFATDEGSTDPIAYNGEKTFSNVILALTFAESPIACFITNHGERTDEITALRTLVDRAGYEVRDIDLEREEIPENCRMLICYDPETDFHAFGNLGEGGVSEIERLDAYLDKCYSFMLFVDADTPVLPNLEEYLEEWGVTVSRGVTAEGETDTCVVRDMTNRIDKDGYSLIASYATAGLGSSITDDMRSVGYPAKVIFPNATAIAMSDTYSYAYAESSTDSSELSALLGETGATDAPSIYRYGEYYKNGVQRYFDDVFVASANAVTEIGGVQYEITTAGNSFRLMTLSSEERILQETNNFHSADRSHVCVFASTEFASNELLESAAYGNADVLTSALRVMGREVAPVSLELKWFKQNTVDTDAFTAGGYIATVACLALIPAAICFGVGIYVTVRRKNK